MPRKSAETKTTTVEEVASKATETVAKIEASVETVPAFGRELAAAKWSRDELGLLKDTTYKFLPDGRVDWKAMIPPEFIVVNDAYFQERNMDIPTSIDGLADNQLLVTIEGFKEVARLRGIVNWDCPIIQSGADRAVAECFVEFIESYETRGGMPSKIRQGANATLSNTTGDFQMYLETIASNRAFSRAIRNGLGIKILGQEEIKLSGEKRDEDADIAEPWTALATEAKNFKSEKSPNGFPTFEDFKKSLIEKGVTDADGWQDWKDIPTTACFKFVQQLKKAKTK